MTSVAPSKAHLRQGGSASVSAAVDSPFADSTTHRGDVAEMLAAAELLRRGYRVSRPLSNGTPYDLIVDDGGKLHKIQVKRAYRKDGGLAAKLHTSKGHRGRPSVRYDLTCDAAIVVDCDVVRFFAFIGAELATEIYILRESPGPNSKHARRLHLCANYNLDRLFPPMTTLVQEACNDY